MFRKILVVFFIFIASSSFGKDIFQTGYHVQILDYEFYDDETSVNIIYNPLSPDTSTTYLESFDPSRTSQQYYVEPYAGTNTDYLDGETYHTIYGQIHVFLLHTDSDSPGQQYDVNVQFFVREPGSSSLGFGAAKTLTVENLGDADQVDLSCVINFSDVYTNDTWEVGWRLIDLSGSTFHEEYTTVYLDELGAPSPTPTTPPTATPKPDIEAYSITVDDDFGPASLTNLVIGDSYTISYYHRNIGTSPSTDTTITLTLDDNGEGIPSNDLPTPIAVGSGQPGSLALYFSGSSGPYDTYIAIDSDWVIPNSPGSHILRAHHDYSTDLNPSNNEYTINVTFVTPTPSPADTPTPSNTPTIPPTPPPSPTPGTPTITPSPIPSPTLYKDIQADILQVLPLPDLVVGDSASFSAAWRSVGSASTTDDAVTLYVYYAHDSLKHGLPDDVNVGLGAGSPNENYFNEMGAGSYEVYNLNESWTVEYFSATPGPWTIRINHDLADSDAGNDILDRTVYVYTPTPSPTTPPTPPPSPSPTPTNTPSPTATLPPVVGYTPVPDIAAFDIGNRLEYVIGNTYHISFQFVNLGDDDTSDTAVNMQLLLDGESYGLPSTKSGPGATPPFDQYFEPAGGSYHELNYADFWTVPVPSPFPQSVYILEATHDYHDDNNPVNNRLTKIIFIYTPTPTPTDTPTPTPSHTPTNTPTWTPTPTPTDTPTPTRTPTPTPTDTPTNTPTPTPTLPVVTATPTNPPPAYIAYRAEDEIFFIPLVLEAHKIGGAYYPISVIVGATECYARAVPAVDPATPNLVYQIINGATYCFPVLE